MGSANGKRRQVFLWMINEPENLFMFNGNEIPEILAEVSTARALGAGITVAKGEALKRSRYISTSTRAPSGSSKTSTRVRVVLPCSSCR